MDNDIARMHREKLAEVDSSTNRYQQIFNETKAAWIPTNFASQEELIVQLSAFIRDMHQADFDVRVRINAADDILRDEFSKLSKEERDKLINNPAFKPVENKEFKTRRTSAPKEKLTKAQKNAEFISTMFSAEELAQYLKK